MWYFCKQDIVLCKIYRKATSLKVLEERAAREEEMKQLVGSPESPPSSTDTMSFISSPQQHVVVLKKESETEEMVSMPRLEKTKSQLLVKDNKTTCCGTSLQLPLGKDKLPELQLPMTADWTQDTFWAQLNSPWLQNWTAYSNILNF